MSFGHSTLEIDVAARLLKDEGVRELIDIRSHPTSNHVPQWTEANLQVEMPRRGIAYKWLPNLGGWSIEVNPSTTPDEIAFMQGHDVDVESYMQLRDGVPYFPKSRIGKKISPTNLPQEPAWNNVGLRDYSYYMMTPAFFEGIRELFEEEAKYGTVAFMCAELLWWKCHRSLVSDYLVWKGFDVYHLQPQFKSHRAAIGNRLERYEAPIRQAWGAS